MKSRDNIIIENKAWQAVLDFWFDPENKTKRFKKDEDFDNEIHEKFYDIWKDACDGLLYTWRETIEGRLAEIIVLDQFSRNLCRESDRAFSQDKMALVLSQESLKHIDYCKLSQEQRKFLIMPFMHSESKKIQEKSIVLFEELGDPMSTDFAYKHKEIIDKFARYPHRNKALKRKSTYEEIEFLKQEGSSF